MLHTLKYSFVLFRNLQIRLYALFKIPGFAFYAVLQNRRIETELLFDYEKYLLFERDIGFIVCESAYFHDVRHMTSQGKCKNQHTFRTSPT